MKLEVVQYEEHESKPWIRFRFLYTLSGPDILIKNQIEF